MRTQTINSGGSSAKRKSSLLSSNPVMRRLDKITETSPSNAATYGGITVKTVFFILFTIVGIIVHLVMAEKLAVGETFTFNYKGFEVEMFKNELIALGASVALALVFQLMAFFIKVTIPVTGALYCVTQGYFISFLVFKVLKGYEYLGALALVITLVIIMVMAILYCTGIIRVTKKFKMIMTTLFVTVVSTTLLSIVGYFIPLTRPLVTELRNNIVFSLVTSVVFIIIASLFLICDFDTIDHVVSDRLPKKYEWQAAFGLAFTVIWLYLKILDIILTIAGNKNDS